MANAQRAYLRGRLVGRLVAFHNSEKGFAFLSTGLKQPEYFVLRADVLPEHWFEGSMLEFTPAPPKAGTKSMRAENIIPRNTAVEEERAS